MASAGSPAMIPPSAPTLSRPAGFSAPPGMGGAVPPGMRRPADGARLPSAAAPPPSRSAGPLPSATTAGSRKGGSAANDSGGKRGGDAADGAAVFAKLSSEFSAWCAEEMRKLTGSASTLLPEFLSTLDTPADVEQYVREYLGSGAAEMSFASEFVRRQQFESDAADQSKPAVGGGGATAGTPARRMPPSPLLCVILCFYAACSPIACHAGHGACAPVGP